MTSWGDDVDEARPAPVRAGSVAEGVGEEVLSAAIDLPWDDWLGPGASDRVRDGSLGLVRTAWPATAARDMRAAATVAGMLAGDAATRERLGAVAVAVASGLGTLRPRDEGDPAPAPLRPARMPHRRDEEPYAWWVAEEKALVWMPWTDAGAAPYGLELLDTGQADAVTVAAPDACWTVFRSGLPPRGARGTWAELPERLRAAMTARAPEAIGDIERGGRWRRAGDTVEVMWRDGAGRVQRAGIAVNVAPSPSQLRRR